MWTASSGILHGGHPAVEVQCQQIGKGLGPPSTHPGFSGAIIAELCLQGKHAYPGTRRRRSEDSQGRTYTGDHTGQRLFAAWVSAQNATRSRR